MAGDIPTRPTLSDVARLAGVDRAVVSRVLNRDPALRVRDSTRHRVLAAIDELDYRPHAVARSLRTTRAGMYGLMIPDFTNPIYATIIAGAERAAAEQGYVLLTGSPQGRDITEYLDLLGRGRVDGLLVAGGTVGPAVTERVVRFGVPWLLLNRKIKGSRRHVVLDEEAALSVAIDHLVGLGHTHIAHLAGPLSADSVQRRVAGYRKAMRAAALPVSRNQIVETDFTHHGGWVAMGALLARRQPPTAVVVTNMSVALGAVTALRQHGWKVPQDVSVVAIHDLPFADFLSPPLTAVRMPLTELGRQGIELLSSMPGDAPIEVTLSEPIELVVRESTSAPRATTQATSR